MHTHWDVLLSKPSTLSLGDASLGPSGVAAARALKSLPPQFESSNLVERQYFATSEDGTSVSTSVCKIFTCKFIAWVYVYVCNVMCFRCHTF